MKKIPGSNLGLLGIAVAKQENRSTLELTTAAHVELATFLAQISVSEAYKEFRFKARTCCSSLGFFCHVWPVPMGGNCHSPSLEPQGQARSERSNSQFSNAFESKYCK